MLGYVTQIKIYSLLKSVIYIVPTLLHSKLQHILKTWRKITTEDRPLDLWKDIVMPFCETML